MPRDTRTAAERRLATGLVAQVIRLTPQQWAKLDEIREDEGMTRSVYVATCVDRDWADLKDSKNKSSQKRPK